MNWFGLLLVQAYEGKGEDERSNSHREEEDLDAPSVAGKCGSRRHHREEHHSVPRCKTEDGTDTETYNCVQGWTQRDERYQTDLREAPLERCCALDEESARKDPGYHDPGRNCWK